MTSHCFPFFCWQLVLFHIRNQLSNYHMLICFYTSMSWNVPPHRHSMWVWHITLEYISSVTHFSVVVAPLLHTSKWREMVYCLMYTMYLRIFTGHNFYWMHSFKTWSNLCNLWKTSRETLLWNRFWQCSNWFSQFLLSLIFNCSIEVLFNPIINKY